MIPRNHSRPQRIGNLTYLKVSPGKYFFDYTGRNIVFSGTLDLHKKRYRLIHLFLYAFLISSLVVGIFYQPEKTASENQATISPEEEENDWRDKEAKKGETKYLEETEAQKEAILSGQTLTSIAPLPVQRIKFRLSQYRVKKKDTLPDLANRFGISVESIAGSSGISPESILYQGQILNIPNKQGLVYKMKRGDTLAKVSDFYKVSLEAIAEENNLEDLDFLQPGQTVFLPGAVIPEPLPMWRSPVPSKLITSGWGTRTYPQYKFHTAIDLRANYEPVYPARKGRVVYAGWMGGYGNTVVIRHDDVYQSVYAHNSRLYVRPGDLVSLSKPIARSGCTGYCFGPHLHFELIKDGKYVNPVKVIKGFVYK